MSTSPSTENEAEEKVEEEAADNRLQKTQLM